MWHKVLGERVAEETREKKNKIGEFDNKIVFQWCWGNFSLHFTRFQSLFSSFKSFTIPIELIKLEFSSFIFSAFKIFLHATIRLTLCSRIVAKKTTKAKKERKRTHHKNKAIIISNIFRMSIFTWSRRLSWYALWRDLSWTKNFFDRTFYACLCTSILVSTADMSKM